MVSHVCNDQAHGNRNHRATNGIYNKGDKVRVKQTVFNTKVRKAVKSNLQKHIHVKYSIDIYEIYKVLESSNTNGLPRYNLTLNNHIIVSEESNKPFQFQHNDLQVINISSNNVIDKNTSNKLNNI